MTGPPFAGRFGAISQEEPGRTTFSCAARLAPTGIERRSVGAEIGPTAWEEGRASSHPSTDRPIGIRSSAMLGDRQRILDPSLATTEDSPN